MYRCAMASPAPVYFVYYGLGKTPVAVYTQAFRVVACMRALLNQGYIKDLDLFHIDRVGISKKNEFLNVTKDVSEDFIRIAKSYGTSERV